MRIKVIFLCAMLAVAAVLAACAAEGSHEVSLDVSCDEFMAEQHMIKTIEAAAGDIIKVTLCSNATTGFQWAEAAQIGNTAILKQTSHLFVPPQSEGNNSMIVGAPGQEVWTFKALQKGQTTVSFNYSRPWEGGEKGVWTLALTVDVE